MVRKKCTICGNIVVDNSDTAMKQASFCCGMGMSLIKKKKCNHSERVGNYCEHCETGGYVSKVEKKLKKMAGF